MKYSLSITTLSMFFLSIFFFNTPAELTQALKYDPADQAKEILKNVIPHEKDGLARHFWYTVKHYCYDVCRRVKRRDVQLAMIAGACTLGSVAGGVALHSVSEQNKCNELTLQEKLTSIAQNIESLHTTHQECKIIFDEAKLVLFTTYTTRSACPLWRSACPLWRLLSVKEAFVRDIVRDQEKCKEIQKIFERTLRTLQLEQSEHMDTLHSIQHITLQEILSKSILTYGNIILAIAVMGGLVSLACTPPIHSLRHFRPELIKLSIQCKDEQRALVQLPELNNDTISVSHSTDTPWADHPAARASHKIQRTTVETDITTAKKEAFTASSGAHQDFKRRTASQIKVSESNSYANN